MRMVTPYAYGIYHMCIPGNFHVIQRAQSTNLMRKIILLFKYGDQVFGCGKEQYRFQQELTVSIMIFQVFS